MGYTAFKPDGKQVCSYDARSVPGVRCGGGDPSTLRNTYTYRQMPATFPTQIPGTRETTKRNPCSAFTADDRYSRQVLFGGIGEAGQNRLATAHAAVVGVGATGGATAALLARAGVGKLTLIDRDFVEPSNLQRQVLFDEEDAR